MASFEFPRHIEYDNHVWHLVYSPSNTETILPNLEGFHVISVDCQPVNVPGRENPIYITIIDLVYPAHSSSSGEAIAERRMKGFRTYSEPPINPASVQPRDCVFYITVPQPVDRSSAQRFFDSVIGKAKAKLEQQVKSDYSWCEDLANLQEPTVEQPSVRQGTEERTISDQQLS